MADNPTHASVLICPKGEEFGTITTEQYEQLISDSYHIVKEITPQIYANWVFNIRKLTKKEKTTSTPTKPYTEGGEIPPPSTFTTEIKGVFAEVDGFDDTGYPKFKEVQGFPPRNIYSEENTRLTFYGSIQPIRAINDSGYIYDLELLAAWSFFIYRDSFYISIPKRYAVGDELEFTTVTNTVVATQYNHSGEYADVKIDTTYTITEVYFKDQ